MYQKRPVLRAAALCAPLPAAVVAHCWRARSLWPLAPYPARRSTTGTIRRSTQWQDCGAGCELLVYRVGGPLDVSGGEQVQECVAQDGEHDSAQCLTGRGVAFDNGLSGAEHGKPVLDGGADGALPWPVGVDQERAHSPQPTGSAGPVLGCRELGPHLLGQCEQPRSVPFVRPV